MKKQKGITLIALVITIIVLLVLAVVSIRIAVNNGIITKANEAVNAYSEEEIREKIELAYSEYKMERINNSDYTMQDAINNSGLEGATVTGDETSGWTITVPTKDGDKVFFLRGDGSVEKLTAVYDTLPEDFWVADEETKTAKVNNKYLETHVSSSTSSGYTNTITTYTCAYTKLTVPSTAIVINEDGSTKQVDVEKFNINQITNITHLRILEGIIALPSIPKTIEEVIIPNGVKK